MSILRTIVILANIGVFVWLIWLSTVEGVSGSGWFPFLALLLLIMMNLYFIIFKQDDGSWIGLFFKRKTLEERKKIDDLKNQKDK